MLLNKSRLHYTVSGTDRNESLILLHDNGLSSRMFESDVKFYESYFKTICIDLAGHGKSGKYIPETSNFWIDNAEKVISTMEKLKIPKASIIGTGGGAIIALQAALHAPTLVKCIIADSPLPMSLDYEYIESLQSFRSSPAEMDRQLYTHCCGTKWEKTLAADTQLQQDFVDSASQLFNKGLDAIVSPVLITGSQTSNLVKNNKDLIIKYSDALKKSQAHIFGNGNHPTILYKTDEFRTISLNFLMGKC